MPIAKKPISNKNCQDLLDILQDLHRRTIHGGSLNPSNGLRKYLGDLGVRYPSFAISIMQKQNIINTFRGRSKATYQYINPIHPNVAMCRMILTTAQKDARKYSIQSNKKKSDNKKNVKQSFIETKTTGAPKGPISSNCVFIKTADDPIASNKEDMYFVAQLNMKINDIENTISPLVSKLNQLKKTRELYIS